MPDTTQLTSATTECRSQATSRSSSEHSKNSAWSFRPTPTSAPCSPCEANARPRSSSSDTERSVVQRHRQHSCSPTSRRSSPTSQRGASSSSAPSAYASAHYRSALKTEGLSGDLNPLHVTRPAVYGGSRLAPSRRRGSVLLVRLFDPSGSELATSRRPDHSRTTSAPGGRSKSLHFGTTLPGQRLDATNRT